MILILIDRSYSMAEQTPDQGPPLAEVVAQVVNDTLYDLCLRCIVDQAEGPRPYFRVGLIGYGMSASGDREAVEPGFGGNLTGRDVVDTVDLAKNPVRIAERSGGAEVDGAVVRVPEWVEPVAGYGTPMCQAFFEAGRIASEFCKHHPNSYPPIVLNVTDGMPTDAPFSPPGGQPASLAEWARRLTTLETSAGALLFFNAFITSQNAMPDWFPSTPTGLPEEGRTLFEISSPLPPRMAALANDRGIPTTAGARGLVVNANSRDLAAFLEIGTVVPDAKVGD